MLPLLLLMLLLMLLLVPGLRRLRRRLQRRLQLLQLLRRRIIPRWLRLRRPRLRIETRVLPGSLEETAPARHWKKDKLSVQSAPTTVSTPWAAGLLAVAIMAMAILALALLPVAAVMQATTAGVGGKRWDPGDDELLG